MGGIAKIEDFYDEVRMDESKLFYYVRNFDDFATEQGVRIAKGWRVISKEDCVDQGVIPRIRSSK